MKQLLIFLGLACAVVLMSTSSTHAASLNNFSISTYNIDYRLGRNQQSASTLTTTETITAEFPNSNQNHGIERAIPEEYDGHRTKLTVTSVTNEAGQNLSYTAYKSNGNRVLRIGDANKYVHGTQTYVIRYTQTNVTKYFSNTQSDEFYWDTNGTDWRVPIDSLQVSLTVDKALVSSLTGKTACYQGISNSESNCQLLQADNTFSVAAGPLGAGENVTVAVGFKPQTFAAYQPTLFERLVSIWAMLRLASFIVAVLAVVWAIVRWTRRSNRSSERSTIIPEYLPPSKTSVTTSASIARSESKAFAAQLIDFAVRHYIKIYETKQPSRWRRGQYDIEVIRDVSTLLPEEQEILSDIFDGTPKIGQRLSLKSLQNNYAVTKRISDNRGKLKKLVRERYGLRSRDPEQRKWFTRMSIILLVLSILALSPFLLAAAIVVFILGVTLYPLTDAGLSLSRYLLGLKEYIKVAEVDRLKMLQSPEGAAKVGSTDPNNPAQLVKLYERVLPYAILFGQEKQWNAQLGRYYESMQSRPDWYQGNSAVFNAALFSSAMSSFSTAAGYSAPSSSSSGGSGGGGFSGGGGGGGGGGGW